MACSGVLEAGSLYDVNIETVPDAHGKTWPSTHRDLTEAEWPLIADLVPDFSGNGKIGRPPTHSKRDIVNAILYVAATGCRWRALPSCYPHWNTVH
ncbi:MAG: transposase, partial [Gallionella sp.]|nr:transposase [Gallionella sp.]